MQHQKAETDDLFVDLAAPLPLFRLPVPYPGPQFSLLVLLKTGSQVKLSAKLVLYFLGRDCQILLSFPLIISCVSIKHDRTSVSVEILQRTVNLPCKRKYYLLAMYKAKCIFVARDQTFPPGLFPPVLQVVQLKFKLRKNKVH